MVPGSGNATFTVADLRARDQVVGVLILIVILLNFLGIVGGGFPKLNV